MALVSKTELDGPARIRLVQALSRAHLSQFGPAEWGGFAGAMGDAHMVHFHEHDHQYLAEKLGVAHIPRECFVIILDEGGLTWNISSPVNMFGWQVCVSLDVSIHEAPCEAEFWTPDRIGSDLDKRVAALTDHELRALIMACPEEARSLVLDGVEIAREARVGQRIIDAARELTEAMREARES